MHQTTVRFGHELWQELVAAATAGGVSTAQYVREAAVSRLAQSAAEHRRHPDSAPRGLERPPDEAAA